MATKSPDIFVLAFVNSKGGSWKSTGSINFAVAAQEAGETVMIFDCDVHQGSVKMWSELRNGEPPVVKTVHAGNIDRAIAWASHQGCNLVILDLPGRDGVDVTDILRRADYAIIPAQPTALDLKGSAPTRKALRTLECPYSVLLTRMNSTTTARAQRYREIYGGTGQILDAGITDRVVFPDATERGRAVLEFSGPSAQLAANEVRAAFAAFLKIVERLNA